MRHISTEGRPDIANCVICGKVFVPRNTRHCTCSAECSRKNKEAWFKIPEVAEKRAKNQRERLIASGKQNHTRCLICGEKVEHCYEKNSSFRRLHEECVKEDTLKTLLDPKGKLTRTQRSRLASFGYGVKDLWEEVKESGML